MKTLRIEIAGLPHCPRNRSHIATIIRKGGKPIPSIIRTEAAHSYEAALKKLMVKYAVVMSEFLAEFKEESQNLYAEWDLYSPGVMTKKGAMSKTGVDLDAHKVLQDTIMREIGIDDAFIKKDCREKHEGDFCVKLTLKIRENNGAHYL